MADNNYEGLRDLRHITESLMDANAHAHELLNRACEADELRDMHAKVNLLQRTVREKISTYTLYINQAIKAADELEGKEDLLTLQLLDMLGGCQSEAEGMIGHLTEATMAHEGWVRRHLSGLKAMLRAEKVSA